ncbi:MBL fold metallo-hydrolase [Candidatus Bipolaricaulota bacterium]
MKTDKIEVMILGTAQDGGIPQLGCDCSHCRAAWEDDSERRLVASLGIVDHEAKAYWLVDSSPDMREQVHLLVSSFPGYRLAGLLLTHAHMGHYLGMAFLGRESWDTQHLPVLCTQRMANFLKTNQPWKQLVELVNIAPTIVKPGNPVQLGSAVAATPILVPHRDEVSDTVAWRITGPKRRLVYCPDIDRWEGPILEAIDDADIALLDGTFYSTDELPGRDVSEIPHPCIADSMNAFQDFETDIRFIHLNHSNRLVSDERLIERVKEHGFDIGKGGSRIQL